MIRAAYAGVDQDVGYAAHTVRLVAASMPEVKRVTDEAIDEGERVGALYLFCRGVRQKVRAWRQRRGRDR